MDTMALGVVEEKKGKKKRRGRVEISGREGPGEQGVTAHGLSSLGTKEGTPVL